MEAHEDILRRVLVAEELLALDALLEHVLRHRVVDVEQRDGILCDAGAYEFRQSSVDVYLARHGNAAAGKTAVHVAGHETELRLEGGPALVGHSHELAAAFVSLYPVEQRQLILCELRKHLRNLVAVAQFLSHVLHHLVDARVALMLLEGLQQVKL